MRVNAIMPTCISCGSSIGEKYEIYYIIQVERVKKYCQENNCATKDSASLENVNMKDILDILHIDNICCRSKILGFNRGIINVYK